MKNYENQKNSVGAARYLPAAGGAMLIVVGLLYVMQLLIDVKFQEPAEAEPVVLPDIWAKETVVKDRPRQEPTKIIPPNRPPERPRDPMVHEPSNAGVKIGAPTALQNLEVNPFSGLDEGAPMLLRSAQPNYPTSALQRGLQG